METQKLFFTMCSFLVDFEDPFPFEGNGNYCRQRQNNLNQKRPKGLSRLKRMYLEVGGWELAISQEGLKAISLPNNSRLNANLHIFSGLKGLILSRALLLDVYWVCTERSRKVAKDLTFFAIVCILTKTNAMHPSRPNAAEIAQEPR